MSKTWATARFGLDACPVHEISFVLNARELAVEHMAGLDTSTVLEMERPILVLVLCM